jgi:GntR family transcriptional regulator
MTQTNEDTARRPRYLKVRDRLVELIRSGAWAPGQAIPSEQAIAREFRISQGTARSAITMLAGENVVVRRHGLGTFVYEHTPEDELARFVCLFDARRARIGADATTDRPVRASASQTECRELQLPKGSRVLRITRVRARNGAPFVLERISLPEARFPDLAERQRLPGMLYELYQKSYGVLVIEVEERLSAVVADSSATKALEVVSGTPLLRIECVAMARGGEPVEWRVSLCHLADARYIARHK